MGMILLPYNISSTVFFPLVGSGTAAFTTAGSGSLTGTNVQVSKDGATFATSTNTGTHVGLGIYSLVLTTSELSAKQVMVLVRGSAGTIWEDQGLLIFTYGNASAMYPFDFGTALSAQTVGTVTRIAGSGVTDVWGAGTRTLTGGTYASDLVTILGTAITGTGGRQEVNVSHLKGTAAAGTQGTANVNVTAIGGDATAATIAGTAFLTIVRGSATGSPLTTTEMKTDFAETSDDHYNGRIVIFLGGTLEGQASDITDYAGNSKVFTYSTLTEAPADGQRFLVV